MRKIMFVTVLVCLVVFVMSTYAENTPKDVNVANEPTVHVETMPEVNFDGNVNVINTPLDVNITNESLLVEIKGPDCSGTSSGTHPPAISYDGHTGLQVGDIVVISLNASDPDGQDITINSEFVEMPPLSVATLAPTVGSTPAFIPDVAGVYVIRSTVVDSVGCSSSTDTNVPISSVLP